MENRDEKSRPQESGLRVALLGGMRLSDYCQKIAGSFLLLGLCGVVRAEIKKNGGYVPPKFEAPPAHIPGATRYVYKKAGAFDLPLYVFQPPAGSPVPHAAILFFHGSGWHSGTVIQFVEHAKALAAAGCVAAVVEYRVKITYNATPADGVADAKSAVRWLRKNAEKFQIDPHKIAVSGGSAGAHLALCAAVLVHSGDEPGEDSAISSRPDAVLVFATPTDTTTMSAESRALFQGHELDVSPLQQLQPGTPPIQMFQGVQDIYATYKDVQRFARAVRANGDECDVVPFENRSHFFYNHPAYYTKYPDFTPVGRPNDFDLCLLLMKRFLYARGFLSENPHVPDKDSTVSFPVSH
jgi:acetyl esterase/lipase